MREASFRVKCCTLLAGVSAVVAGGAAHAVDYTLAGFATLGYARSGERFQYLRYIDKQGTLKADSLIGLQGEAKFDPQWSATAQIVASAPRTRDDGVEATVRWAFASYRPNNDWLLRAGRLRPPVLINTQNAEVGMTFDQVRLPVEVYSLSPVYDLDGAAFTRTWIGNESETVLDGYLGVSKVKFRIPFQRDANQTIFPDRYLSEKVNFMGLVVSHNSGPLLLRAGMHHAVIQAEKERPFHDFLPRSFPGPSPFGGVLFAPGKAIDSISVNVLTFGADWRHGNWRLSGEYGQSVINDTQPGIGDKRAYVTIARAFELWTPYVSFARILSASENRKYYRALKATPVPLGAQGSPLFVPGNFHQILADRVQLYDQYSVMIGAAYNLSLTSKLKFEWMRTRIGMGSALVDGDVRHQGFNVLSVSYNVTF